jgi:phage gp36-like protein
MTYSIQSDIVDQLDEDSLIQLTDDEDAGEVNEGRVAKAIADADATINAYCQGIYMIPLDPVPDKIRQISVDIAIYNLFSRRGDTAPDIRIERHKEAIRFLEKVADGRISLGAATPAPVNTRDTVNILSNDRIFDRSKMSGF